METILVVTHDEETIFPGTVLKTQYERPMITQQVRKLGPALPARGGRYKHIGEVAILGLLEAVLSMVDPSVMDLRESGRIPGISYPWQWS